MMERLKKKLQSLLCAILLFCTLGSFLPSFQTEADAAWTTVLTQAQIDAAIRWAKNKKASDEKAGKMSYKRGKMTYCGSFVMDSYQTGAKIDFKRRSSAKSMADAADKAGALHKDRFPEVGAFVYWKWNKKDSSGHNYGHVGLYIGNGQMINVRSKGITIETWTNPEKWTTHGGFTYLGWSAPEGYTFHPFECTRTETNLTLTTTRPGAKLLSMPCFDSRRQDSVVIKVLNMSEELTATAVYTSEYNEGWYRAATKDGKEGYVYGGEVSAAIPGSALSGAPKLSTAKPKVGNAVTISGTLKGNSVKIASINGVLTGSDGTTLTKEVTPKAASYNLKGSALAKAMNFKKLKHGPGSLKLTIKLSAPATDGAKQTTVKRNITKTLKFTEIGSYKVRFNANGGSGAPDAVTKKDLRALTLPTKKPTYPGFKFLGWATRKNATEVEFKAGGKLNVDATDGGALTLYAVWQSTSGVAISSANFPDAAFRAVVKQFDTNHDLALSKAEIAAVTELDCSEKGISSLQGIEHFTKLTRLDCYSNKLTTLDLSKNTALDLIDCTNNNLTSLVVNKCTALRVLMCDGNALTALNVSGCTKLERLVCNENQLATLNLSSNPNLLFVYCDGNKLTSVDLSACTGLIELSCAGNKLAKLDLSKCSLMRSLLAKAAPHNISMDVNGTEISAISYEQFIDDEYVSLMVDPSVTLVPTPSVKASAEVTEAAAASAASASASNAALDGQKQAEQSTEAETAAGEEAGSDASVPSESESMLTDETAAESDQTMNESEGTPTDENIAGSEQDSVADGEKQETDPVEDTALEGSEEAQETLNAVDADNTGSAEAAGPEETEVGQIPDTAPADGNPASEEETASPDAESPDEPDPAEPADIEPEEQPEAVVDGAADDVPEEPVFYEEPEEDPVQEEVPETPEPATVVFSVSPDYAFVTVFNEYGDMQYEDDGCYLLMPGEYRYSVSADGYEPVEDIVFTVSEGELLSFDVVLNAVVLSEEEPAPAE